MRVPFGCKLLAAHLNRLKRFEVVLGPQPITAVAETLFLPSCCVPHLQDYCRYLCTLFVISLNKKTANKLQSYDSVSAKLAWLPIINFTTWSSGRVLPPASLKSVSTAVATPRMLTPNPSMQDSLASPMVAAGTVRVVTGL